MKNSNFYVFPFGIEEKLTFYRKKISNFQICIFEHKVIPRGFVDTYELSSFFFLADSSISIRREKTLLQIWFSISHYLNNCTNLET